MLAVSAYEIVLAVHVMAVVIAFGATFAYPIMFAVAARADPRSLPTMHRVEYTIERILVNGGLVVVVAAGIFLASDSHQWSEFFVQWGLGVAIVIGGLVGAVMIPTAKRAEQAAARDLANGAAQEGALGAEYQALVRRLQVVGTGLSMLVLVTIFFMVTRLGS
jgi:uncharacterized membrane protein